MNSQTKVTTTERWKKSPSCPHWLVSNLGRVRMCNERRCLAPKRDRWTGRIAIYSRRQARWVWLADLIAETWPELLDEDGDIGFGQALKSKDLPKNRGHAIYCQETCQTYSSISEAARKLGLSWHTVAKSANERCGTYNGYTFIRCDG